ncbi:MAG: hypothetical protein JXB50_11880 [Spirochaetes bacterium]|nr:hypothetical protein [Spirochaetota bacterium]
MKKVFISSYSSISALGIGSKESSYNLKSDKDFIYYPEKSDKYKLPFFKVEVPDYKNVINKCSNISLRLLSLIEEYWLKLAPIPLFIATSTGGIRETEDNFTDLINKKCDYPLFGKHYLNCISDDIKNKYKDKINNFFTISTACSSAAQALLKAFLYLKNGIIDKAIVIGVDSLSLTTMIGFDSLKLVSHSRSIPLSLERDGLSLGEGGGILVLETEPLDEPFCEILSAKSTSDGFHISSPEPEGKQQAHCIIKAVTSAGIDLNDIDYINAHGTGTLINDEVEMKVIKNLFPQGKTVTSTKTFIGHTLGASAIIELSLVIDMLKDDIIYQKMGKNTPMDKNYIPDKTVNKKIKYFIKNSFGFGGNNVCLVLKKINNPDKINA